MTPVKFYDGSGNVFARTEHDDGSVVLQKRDPAITHDAPTTVGEGDVLTVTFTIYDFDGERRHDTGGDLLLDIGGTDVTLPIIDGTAVLVLQLYVSIVIQQRAPYFCDARMAPLHLEVTA